jgi:hypothetical protein
VEQILVRGPWLGFGLSNRDVFGIGVFKKCLSSSKAVVEFYAAQLVNEHGSKRSVHAWDSPGSNDFDVRLKTVEGELEPNLVVAFASATVRDETKLCETKVCA